MLLLALLLSLTSFASFGTPVSAQGAISCAIATPDPAASPVASPAVDLSAIPELPGVTLPENATTVSFGYLPVSIFAPVFVAYEKGYFAEYGLDVQLQSFPGGTDMVLQAATGDLDLGIGGVGPAYWNAASQDLGLKIIAPGHSEGNPVASPLMISAKACADGSITSVADLKGKKVSVNAPGATEIWMAKALETGGLTLDDVELQFLSFPDAVVALESGAIDAAIIGEPVASAAENNGIAVRLVQDIPVEGIWPTMIFGNEEWITSNPDAAAGVVAGYLRASRDLTENFNDPLNLAIIQKYTEVDPALIAQSVKPVYSTDGTIDLASLSTLQDFFRGRGQLEYDENIDPATLVDPAPGEKALELLGQ
jgi:NitT/TauT family transport system substrate-binding protein